MEQLKLYLPVKPLHINQMFGENPQQYADPKYGGIKGHNGADLMAYHGQPVYASHDGTAYYEIDAGQGHGVVILSNQPYKLADGSTNYVKSIYWHLCDSTKEPQFKSIVEGKTLGIKVVAGQIIGFADNTGASSGDHLHFGLKSVAKDSSGNWYNLNQDNGYLGAIDPVPYFNGLFAQDLDNRIVTTSLATCKMGDTSDTVKACQQWLITHGFNIPAGATGFYGEQTKEAMWRFQVTHAISITDLGVHIGPRTLQTMLSLS